MRVAWLGTRTNLLDSPRAPVSGGKEQSIARGRQARGGGSSGAWAGVEWSEAGSGSSSATHLFPNSTMVADSAATITPHDVTDAHWPASGGTQCELSFLAVSQPTGAIAAAEGFADCAVTTLPDAPRCAVACPSRLTGPPASSIAHCVALPSCRSCRSNRPERAAPKRRSTGRRDKGQKRSTSLRSGTAE